MLYSSMLTKYTTQSIRNKWRESQRENETTRQHWYSWEDKCRTLSDMAPVWGGRVTWWRRPCVCHWPPWVRAGGGYGVRKMSRSNCLVIWRPQRQQWQDTGERRGAWGQQGMWPKQSQHITHNHWSGLPPASVGIQINIYVCQWYIHLNRGY